MPGLRWPEKDDWDPLCLRTGTNSLVLSERGKALSAVGGKVYILTHVLEEVGGIWLVLVPNHFSLGATTIS